MTRVFMKRRLVNIFAFARSIEKPVLKSDNLQYNTLVRWADGTNDSSSKLLTFQVFFFIISYRLRALKTLYFHFCNFIKKNEEINWKGFCKEFCKKLWKKNNTQIITCLVGKSFVPSAQRTSVLYCRLTDFCAGSCCLCCQQNFAYSTFDSCRGRSDQ